MSLSSESISQPDASKHSSKGSYLYLQVIVAIVLGVALGHFLPEWGVALKPLGDLFVKLVKMVIPPVIFLTIVTGIAGLGSLGNLGRVALKSFAYFLFFSTLALIVGLLVGNWLAPGAGMNIDPASINTQGVQEFVVKAHDMTIVGFLTGIVPNSLVGAFVDGNILQVLFIAILFGVAFSMIGEKAQPVIAFFNSLSQGVFRVVDLLMRLAPIGAFGAMAFTIGKFGIGSVVNLAALVATFYITAALFIVVVLGSVCAWSGFSIFRLMAYIKSEILLVIGTSSSESALPSLMEKLEKAGCQRSVVGLVVPTGYSFNLDGTNIYMAMAALFIAQATNTSLSIEQQLLLLAVAMLSSKGAAGVTGSGFITLAATLSVVPSVPLAGIALILGVDRFMSECRAVTNFIGNAVATVVICRWQKALDRDSFSRALANNTALSVHSTAPSGQSSGQTKEVTAD